MLRSWREVCPALSGSSVLRVLQYNILADSLAQGSEAEAEASECPAHLLRPGSAGRHLFVDTHSNCHVFRTSHKNLAWESRFPLILQEILAHSPDVVCLQEVDKFECLRSALEGHGYTGMFCKKAWKKIKDGSAVFWRVAKLRLLHAKDIQLQTNSAMMALLLHLQTASGHPLTVCSTHLKCGFDFEAQRLEQVQNLIKSLLEFAGGSAVLLCGDLNAHCAPIHLCTPERCCDPECTFEPRVVPALLDAGFRNTYDVSPTFTAWSGWLDRDVKAVFDYIFVRGPIAVRRILELPPEEVVAEFPTRLPNQSCPSDHVCLVADVEPLGALDARPPLAPGTVGSVDGAPAGDVQGKAKRPDLS